MNAQRPIGIFDSGIGGLTIAHSINKILPNESIIYYGDTLHLPYGEKSVNAINNYCNKIVDFLIKKNCKAIIFACNSASSVAFRNIFQKVGQDCLLFNVIDPLVEYVVQKKNIKSIGVIGTNATIRSDIYERKINAIKTHIKVHSVATPLLASLIEENNNELYSKNILELYLKNPKLNNIDALILGCTHYPIITEHISHFYNHKINIFDARKHLNKTVKSMLKKSNLLSNKISAKHEFYVSDQRPYFQKKTKLFFPNEIILKEENIFS